MKKSLLCISCFFLGLLSAQAQILYGTTQVGGATGAGVIIKFLPATNNLTVVHNFDAVQYNTPGEFIEGSDGKLYTAVNDGDGIFSFDPATSAYTKLPDADGPAGFIPEGGNYVGGGSLLEGIDGKFYGVTRTGGANDYGVIYSYDPATSTYTKLKDFNGTDGRTPRGELVQLSNGKIYGTTALGGADSLGVLYSFDPATSTFTKLKDFTRTNGILPNGLFQASNGILYGMTRNGGNNDWGVIYSYDPVTNNMNKLWDMSIPGGSVPLGSFVQAPNGKLYGTASGGGSNLYFGTIFSFDPASNTYAKLFDFNEANGNSPTGTLTLASDGKLYGATTLGGLDENGVDNDGVIFSFDPSSSSFAVVHDLSDADGSRPQGKLVQSTVNGKLYGVNGFGGPNNKGFLFTFDISLKAYTATSLAININTGGSLPVGNLVQVSNGNLLGVTVSGGSKGDGIIYSFDTLTSMVTKLHDFDSSGGVNPNGSLVQANNGKIYGMTGDGGNNGLGVIYSLDLASLTYTKLKDFDSIDGAHPRGSLVSANDGKLYGVTPLGGSHNAGVIFSIDPFTSVFTRLYDFDITARGGLNSLVQASDGKLYGVNGGGASGGVFSFDPSSSVYEQLARVGRIGATLVQANNGRLYGTGIGGDRGDGTIFFYDPVTGESNDRIVSSAQLSDLMQASDGKLYGMGGPTNVTQDFPYGWIFSYDFLQVRNLLEFNGSDGAVWSDLSTFIEVTECTTSTAYYKDADGDGYGNRYNWKIAMSKPSGYVVNNQDCDDGNKTIHPLTYYRDADGDSFGDANASISFCGQTVPAGYAINKNDDDDHQKLDYKIGNYPNPFKGTSTIKYALPFDSKVSVKVYDVSGKPVATLVNENKKAGFYTANFNAGSLSSGMLYYRITADSKDQHFEQTKKMILLR